MMTKYLSLFLFTLLSLFVANANAQINPTSTTDLEIIKEREMYSNVFLKENGDKEAIFSSSPIHYKKNGVWETINTMITSINGGYQNKSNVIESYFPKNVSSTNKIKLIVNSKDEVFIHSEKKLVLLNDQTNLKIIAINSNNSIANVSNNTINYSNIYAGISDEFTILNGEIKNNVVLSAPPTLLNNVSSGYFGFQEIVELPKGWKITTLDKAVNPLTSSPLFIFDANGNHILTIPEPIFFDNYGLESDGANTAEGKYLLTQENDSWSITTLIPVEWLKDVNTKYPISIDPTVVLAGATGGWQSPNNFIDNAGFVFIGECCGNLTHRAWIKFNTASIPDNSCITNVELEVNVATVVAATPELVHVNDVTGVFGPYGGINLAAYTDFGTGLYTSFTINGTGTYGYYGLGVTANALLQAQLPVDWFQVALIFDNEPSTNYKIINGTSSNLRVTYNGSCCPPPPAIAAITGPISVCEGSTATYTVPAQAGAAAYNWTVPAGATITSGQNTTSLNVTWNTTPGGQICVDWTDACPATSPQTCLTVTVNPTPPAPTALGVTICPNNSTTLTATAPGGTYEWYDLPIGGTLLITNASYTTPILSANTTYYVQTTVNGCVSPRTAVTVTISPLLVVNAGLDASICFGDTYMLGVTPNGVGYSYVWDEPLNMGFSTILNPTVSPTSTTTYTVTVTDPSNCVGSDNITITVNPTPLAPTALSVTICPNNSTTLTATAPGGTYEWFDAPVAGTLLIANASYTTPVLAANTTYYVQTTVNGCVSPRTAVTVTISPLLVVNAGLDATICSGNSYLLSVLPNGAGYSYVWDEPLNLGFSTIFNPTVNPTSTTTYTVTVTDPNNCVGSDNITITVNPGASTNAIGNIQACPGDIVPASAFTSTPSGGTFAWTNSNTSIGLAASGTGNTPSFTAINSSGSPVIATVSVIATANGCAGALTNYTITVNPVVSSSSNVSICQGDSMLINGVYHASAGNYLDTLLSSFGCDSIITYNLTINMVSVANSNVIVCQGDSVFINGNYYSAAGSYPFTFTSSFGCDSVVIYSVTIAPLPSFNISGGASINIGESSNLAVLPGVFGTSYSWNPPVGLSCYFCQNPIATPLISTWYYVTVTSAAGCETTDSVYIEVDPSTNIYIPNIFSPNNDDNNDVYLVRGKGVDQFNLAIYNRWGQLIFESKDIEQGWDGTKDGTPLNQGVFVYKLQVIMYNSDRFEQTGNITLIR